MAPSLSKISWGFLATGFFAPLVLQGLFYTGILPIEVMPDWIFITLWPAFGFYLASDTGGGADSGREVFGFVMSVLANALLYLLVGSLISFIYRRLLLRGHAPASKLPG
jgi:hypothetical protein